MIKKIKKQKCYLQIHDELIFETHKEDTKRISKIIMMKCLVWLKVTNILFQYL